MIKNNRQLEIANQQGDQLTFSNILATTINDNSKKFKEINISNKSLIAGNLSQVGLQIASQAFTLSSIASQAPNGLYAATASSQSLSKLANGTTSTIVRDNGKIISHAGFKEIGLSPTLNPAMVASIGLQAMAMISGTYYLHSINKQLSRINSKLSELIEMHHDEKIGMLLTIRENLEDISSRSHFDSSDIATIRDLKKDADNIGKEYLYRLDRLKNENITECKKGQLEELIQKINFTTDVAIEASISSLMCELSEIYVRMLQGADYDIINDLMEQLENHHNKSFFFNSSRLTSELYKKFISIKEDFLKEMKKKKSLLEPSKITVMGIPGIIVAGVPGLLGTAAVSGAKKIKKNVDISKTKNELHMLYSNKDQQLDTVDYYNSQFNFNNAILDMKSMQNKEFDILILEDPKGQRMFIEHQEAENEY